tara:strand:+ start:239 stop:460 length:222 start_codon:yes stop_codon:yes gene_type:complete
MLINFKKVLSVITFNFSLFLVLMIGIQNSTTKKKVNLITNETVKLPVSFIIGISFISGSISGNLLTFNLRKTK